MASPIPDAASVVDAVALVRSGLVALGALDAARPEPGEAVLITAAASGVGHLTVQLARARGAGRVVGAVSDPAKGDFVRALGADEVITYDDLDRPGRGEPFDYVLDAVGGELLTPSIAALAPGGRLVAYSSGGGTVQAYDLLVGAKSVIGFQMARIARGKPELYEQWRRELWRLFGEGALKPSVHGEFALAEAAEAHEVIESRSNLGKVVLRPRGAPSRLAITHQPPGVAKLWGDERCTLLVGRRRPQLTSVTRPLDVGCPDVQTKEGQVVPPCRRVFAHV